MLILCFNSNHSFSQWVQINAPNRVVRSFSLSETKIFAGTYEALYYSSDDGNSWIYSFYDINSTIYPLAINDTLIFLASWNTGVYKSTDGCQSWTQVNNGLCDGIFGLNGLCIRLEVTLRHDHAHQLRG